jgi:hypothetical protein
MKSVNFKKHLYSSYWLFCFNEIILDVYSKCLNEQLNQYFVWFIVIAYNTFYLTAFKHNFLNMYLYVMYLQVKFE